MALRDNNERFEVLGGLLSGLYCPIRERTIPPAIIRKPAIPTTMPAALVGAPSSLDRPASSSKVPDAFKTARMDETAKRMGASARPSEGGRRHSSKNRDKEKDKEKEGTLPRRPTALLHWKPSKLIQEAKQRYVHTTISSW